MAESIKTLVRDVRDTIAANSTKTVDRIPLVAFECLEYSVTYKSDAEDKRKTLKLSLRKDDSTIETQVFAKTGDVLDVAIDADVVGSDAELQVINNEGFDLDFIASRILA